MTSAATETPATLPTAVPTLPPAVTDTLTAVPLPPQLYLTNLGEETISSQQPAYLRLEVGGTAVISLSLQISWQIEEGQWQPLSRQPLLARVPEDGLHQWPLVWYGDGLWAEEETAVPYLSDDPFMAAAGAEITPRQPLPAGDYRLTILAQNEAGATGEASADLRLITPEEPLPGRTYLDPRHGFQFRMADHWQTPVYSGTLLLSTHLTATMQMQLVVYPDLPPRTDAAALIDQTLAQFGPVSRLYEDQLPLDNMRARRVAYGYTRADEAQRRGVLLAFVRQGQGYVLDVEGEGTAETAVWSAAEQMATSWQFTSPVHDSPPHWSRQPVAGRNLAYPTAYTYQVLREWHRFSRDRDTFWAVRMEDAIAVDGAELARRVEDAAAGVSNFEADPAYYFELGPQQWLRTDFVYTNSRDQRIQGAVLLAIVGEQTAVVWLEAPLAEYERLEERDFLLMLVELVRSE
ncbi:MAG: hypothetical protein R6X32_15305 [Chloroflexota bacterium]